MADKLTGDCADGREDVKAVARGSLLVDCRCPTPHGLGIRIGGRAEAGWDMGEIAGARA